MALDYRFKTMESWPLRKTARRFAQFRNAKGRISFSASLKELETEMNELGGRDVVLETGHPEHAIRLDGKLRANVNQPVHPGVILRWSIRGKEGRVHLALECDQYAHWEDNFRAIVKTINALRAVDRWGCLVPSGETFGRQWEALLESKLEERIAEHMRIQAMGATPVARPAALPVLEERLALVRELASIANVTADPAALLQNETALKDTYKIAALRVHPDTLGTGNESTFKRLQVLKEELGI